MKYRKRLTFLLLLLALAGALGWLGGTTSGLRFLAALALPRLPVTLDPAEIEGRLAGPITLGRVGIAAPGLRAELASAVLDWRPGALLRGTFHATELRLAQLRLELLEAAPAGPDEEPPGDGDPFSLPLDLIIERLVVTGGALHAGGEPVAEDIELEVSARATGSMLMLQDLELHSSRGRVAGDAQVALDPAQPWAIDLHWQAPLAGAAFVGHTAIRGPLAELEVTQELSAPLAARLEGIARGLPGRPSWAATLVVDPLPAGGVLWPAAIDGLAARLRLDGDLEHSTISGELQLLGGSVSGAGRIAWAGDLAADFRLDFSDLNPAALAPEWPGRLGGSLQLSGLPGAATGLDVTLRSLRGELRSVPLSGEADLNVGTDRYLLRAARVAVGDASLRASGRLDAAAVALTATLEVPALESLHEEAAGRLRATARVAGARQAPSIALEAAGRDLRWQSQRAQALEVDATLDLSGATASTILAELQGVDSPQGSDADLRLVAEGSPQEHRVRLELDRPEADQGFLLELEGELAGRRWDTLLTDLVLSAAAQPVWSLQAPARLRVEDGAVSLGDACMDGNFGLLCLAGDWRRDGPLRGSARLARLDLAPLSDRFSRGLLATGVLSGEVAVGADGERFQGASGRLELTAGDLWLADEEDKPLLSWARGLLELAGDEDAARATLSLDLADADRADGRLALAWNTPGMPLQGRIDATLTRLHMLPALVPELAELDGEARLGAVIGGTLGAPSVAAELKLQNGAFNMPRLGLRPDQIEALVTLAGSELDFAVEGRSGEGRFRTEGRFDLAADTVAGRATLAGENLLLANLAEARVAASPDLEFRYAGRELVLEGEVVIPFARITELGGPSTVSTSPDEVLVGDYVPPTPEGLRVNSRVQVSVGPDVQIDAAGLRGSVEGSILTVIQPDALPWGRGELRVVDGTFGAFGQRLEIERGRLIYTGGPLDNPGLEIRAVRRLEEVTAGALVRGTLQQPEISIYSDPPMPQAEALSYLTLGRNLADLRTGEQRAVSQAANSLALSGGNLIAKDLGQRLGFAELALAAEGEGTSLVVSRYLGGGLYVGYGIGLFDTVNTLRLRFQVNQRLSLETISGDEQAGDLFYTFERD